MAKISLRAYNREIENLIERGQTSEAIGHGKHILRYYPKHLETYRLLGKAYLEAQRFTEAADILQRLLAAVPDDFIAQLGMSIIREDEGNFDAAIWHMERAFEVQPANGAIQAELRRLYGRRDGVEPPRIRLTRGALVRMYVRGELYPQAIAEIRSALSEDPKRTDLEAILAKVYFESGKKVEATEICGRLVSKFPYCFEACRILAQILPTTSKAEDAKIYQGRIEAMDPYIAYITPNAPTSQDVPEQAVQLERIEWQPITETQEKPAWTSAIGVSWETQEEEQPDWLKSAIPGPTAAPFTATEEPAKTKESPMPPPPLTELPDFLASAGWSAASGDATALPETQLSGEEELPAANFTEEELQSAEIPEWLRAMAPPEAQQPLQEEDESRTTLLESLFSAPATSLTETQSPAPSQQPPAAQAGVPDWLAGLGAQEPTPAEQPPAAEAGVPDWFAGLGAQEPTPAEQPSAAQAGVPDWFAGLGAQEPTPAEQPPAAQADVPDWLAGLGAQEPTPAEQPPAAQAGVPDWLAGLGAQEPTPAEQPPAAQAGVPDWLAGLGAQESAPAEQTPAAEAGVPDWLAGLGAQEPTPAEQPSAAQAGVPDWLNAMQVGESTSIQSSIPEPVAEQPPVSQPPAAEPAQSVSAESDIDSALAWLESLAVKQGADADFLLVDADKRTETPPEWVETAAAEAQAQAQAPEPVAQAPVEAPIEAPEAPVIPEPVAEQPAAEPVAETPANEPVIPVPEWLSGIGEDTEPNMPQAAQTINTGVDIPTQPTPRIEPTPAASIDEPMIQADKYAAPSTEEKAAEPEIPEWIKAGAQAEEEPVDITLPPEWSRSPEEPAPTAPIADESWLTGLNAQDAETHAEQETAWIIEEVAATPVTPTPVSIPIPSLEQPLPATTLEDPNAVLEVAQRAMYNGDLDTAIPLYNQLIDDGKLLEEVIHDLRDALYRYPIDINIWQSLGDAYARNNLLQEALDAYTKAEELLR